MFNFCCGELVPIPTLSALPSTKNRFWSVSPSTLKSLLSPTSLTTTPVAPILSLSVPAIPNRIVCAVPVL